MALKLTGLRTFLKKYLNEPGRLDSMAKHINDKALTQTPGGNLFKDQHFRIDKGYPDAQNSKLIHCDMQINANPSERALKNALSQMKSKGTHGKMVNFLVDTTTGISPEELKNNIIDGVD